MVHVHTYNPALIAVRPPKSRKPVEILYPQICRLVMPLEPDK
jgi:hypothetical protein